MQNHFFKRSILDLRAKNQRVKIILDIKMISKLKCTFISKKNSKIKVHKNKMSAKRVSLVRTIRGSRWNRRRWCQRFGKHVPRIY